MCMRVLPKCSLKPPLGLMLSPLPWVPVPSHPLAEGPVPNIHPKPSLTQLRGILSGPVTPVTTEISVCSYFSLHEGIGDSFEVSSPLNRPSALSCSSCGSFSRCFTILMALLWTLTASFHAASMHCQLCLTFHPPAPPSPDLQGCF